MGARDDGKRDALWVITAYFNWSHYKTKRSNYDMFRAQLSGAGIRLLTVECALYGESFELLGVPDVLQVRTSSVMWQKERLLNVAIEQLPSECRFVAWLDCDLVFENRQWASQAVEQLQSHGVVQLFSEVVRLTRGSLQIDSKAERSIGFMEGLTKSAEMKVSPRLGDPGFAWAARRDVLEACGGLYDACVIGGADRVMAHAWFGDYRAQIVQHIAVGHIAPHYAAWAKRAHHVVRGSVALVPGLILHLWHGELANRHYFDRHHFFEELAFNPRTDLVMNSYGCWEWSEDRPILRNWMEAYFKGRREDG